MEDDWQAALVTGDEVGYTELRPVKVTNVVSKIKIKDGIAYILFKDGEYIERPVEELF